MSLCYTRPLTWGATSPVFSRSKDSDCCENYDEKNCCETYEENECCESQEEKNCYESYDEKNMKLCRPMSPHLTIYKPQLTSVMSIATRATGIILASYTWILGIGTLFIPGGIPCLIHTICCWDLAPAVLVGSKALFCYPLTYHYFNGIRILIWNFFGGKTLELKDVYTTGWIVLALSITSALILAAM
ncbi:succinate dehydrogenase cytochrome b560 subunit, mitochondrial-like [Trichogramma pretiosum]|uniref:succinate dehydrogenase cytochrome b560 subunit, mitochondrial-like n=1 Tax=Trichogramma pretiosum TaxID=7493 RepID=UPI0006C9917C|nr:succinate dehydrogenase cytochrome b560 subunit, mitochondrial-like [Trichogramma pretiosum]